MRQIVVILSAFICSCLLVSAQSQPPAETSKTALTVVQSSEALPIGAGDLIDVEVFDTPELSLSRSRVSPDGMVKLPVVGDIKVVGLTAREASSVIEERLRQLQIMIDPRVIVLITEYATQGIRILGQVKNPGTYLLLGQHSLYDAFAAAGGVTPQAGGIVTITHQEDPLHPEIVTVSSPEYSREDRLTQVRPGDVIVVSKASAVYVFGDVARPGELFIDNGQSLTVLQAVALSQGTARAAAVSKAAVLRQTPSGTVRIPININRIQRNLDVNIALQPADILVIPHSGLKQFVDSALPSATGAVVGITLGAAVNR